MPKYQISTNQGNFVIETDGEATPEQLQEAANNYFNSAATPQQGADTAISVKTPQIAQDGVSGAMEQRLGASSGLLAGQVAGKPVPGLRQTAAPVARYGGAALGSMGGPVGAAISGAGEGLAQTIEGQSDPRALAQSTAMGAVPFAKLTQLGKVAGRLAVPAAAGGTNYIVNKLSDAMYGKDENTPDAEKQAAVVAAVTAAVPMLGRVLGAVTKRVTQDEAARIASMKLNNANKDAVLATMKAEGASVVPSAVNPSMKNKILESIAGIQNVEAGIATNNAPVFNKIGRREASLAADTPINEATLSKAREAIGADSYTAAQQAGFGDELNAWREANTNLKAAQRELEKGFTNARGKAVDDAATALAESEVMLNRVADSPEAAALIQQARVKFAKNYDVGEAVASGTDEVRPSVLSAMLRLRGEDGLTGGLRDIAQFNNAFSRSAKNPTKMATAPGAATAGAALMAGSGDPVSTAAMTGGIPLVRGAVRDLLASPAYQAKNAVRNYTPRTSSDPAVEAIIVRLLETLARQPSNEAIQ